MKQVVYVDVLFAVNLILNYFILLAVAGALRRRERRLRLLAGAALGAFYSLFIFFPQVGFLYSAAGKLCLSAAMVGIAYRWTGARDALRLLVTFYLSSLLLGGGLFALWYFLSPPGLLVRNGVVYLDIPPVPLILSAAAFYIFFTLASRLFRHGGGRLYDMELHCGGTSVRMRALLDTGNGLTDMLTGAPVVVAEYPAVEKLLPLSLRAAVKRGGIGGTDSPWAGRMRLIPYGTVSGKSELLPAFRPDRLEIMAPGEKWETTDVLVAVCPRRLSPGGSYQALLSPLLTQAGGRVPDAVRPGR